MNHETDAYADRVLEMRPFRATAALERANGHGHDEPPPPEPDDYGADPVDLGEPPDPTPDFAPLVFVDPTSWEGLPVPERQWLVRNRIPSGNVTILNGDGAAGKTTIALQLVAAVARGSDWLGAVVNESGRAVFFSAEEDYDEIHRRLGRILDREGLAYGELQGVYLHCCPGEDAVLGAPDKNGIVRPTELMKRLEQTVAGIRPALIVIEAAADVFAGNENDRAQVRQFIGLLRKLARSSGAAVLLLAHPSLTGLASGSGTSGSTAWNNSARSRLYFTTAKARDGDEPDADVRELRVMKSNYGPAGEVVKLRFDRGAFAPEGGPSTIERAAADAGADDAFLRCLDVKTGQGISVGPSTGRNFAPAIFETMAEAAPYKRRALATAMDRLLSAGRIKSSSVGPPSKQRCILARVNQ